MNLLFRCIKSLLLLLSLLAPVFNLVAQSSSIHRLNVGFITTPPYTGNSLPEKGYIPYLLSEVTRDSNFILQFTSFPSTSALKAALKTKKVDLIITTASGDRPVKGTVRSRSLAFEDSVFILSKPEVSKEILDYDDIPYADLLLIDRNQLTKVSPPESLQKIIPDESNYIANAAMGLIELSKNDDLNILATSLQQSQYLFTLSKLKLNADNFRQLPPKIDKRAYVLLGPANLTYRKALASFDQLLSKFQMKHGYEQTTTPFSKGIKENDFTRKALKLFPFREILPLIKFQSIKLTNGDWPPFMGKDLPAEGYLSKLVKEIFYTQGYSVKYDFMNWNRALKATKAGDYAGTFIWERTPDRAYYFEFCGPLHNISTEILYHKDTKFNWKYHEDLKKYSIGITRGYFYGDDFEVLMRLSDMRIDYSPDDLTNLRKLVEKRIDLFFCNRQVGLKLLHENYPKEVYSQIDIHSKPLYTAPHYMLISRQHPGYVKIYKAFNEGFKFIKANGFIEIFEEELLENVLINSQSEGIDE